MENIFINKAWEFLSLYEDVYFSYDMDFFELSKVIDYAFKNGTLKDKKSIFYHLYDDPEMYRNKWGYFPDIAENTSPDMAFAFIVASRKFGLNEYQYFVKKNDGLETLTVFENTRPVIFKQTLQVLPPYEISNKRYKLLTEYLNKYCLYNEGSGNKLSYIIEVGEDYLKLNNENNEVITFSIEYFNKIVISYGFTVGELRERIFKLVR